jgi:hypothetical protein
VIDGVPGVAERRFQLTGEVGIVFDDKNSHLSACP